MGDTPIYAFSPMPWTDRCWMPADPLARGRTYVWQVAAQRASGAITAPAAPAPPAKCHVIDASAADVLERVEAERPQAHFAANAGLPIIRSSLMSESTLRMNIRGAR
jgi:hypothetical protein